MFDRAKDIGALNLAAIVLRIAALALAAPPIDFACSCTVLYAATLVTMLGIMLIRLVRTAR